jgi:hypothetical protein
MTEHDGAMKRFQQWWIQAVRSGYGAAEVWWLHRNSQLVVWRWVTLSAFIWRGPLRAVIVLGALLYLKNVG